MSTRPVIPGLTAALLAGILAVIFMGPCEAAGFKEAPMTAKLSNAGLLPKVEDRLPPEPVVVKPVEKVGEYGGSWRRAYIGLSDLVGARRLLYDPLVRWTPDYAIGPNLAHKWEVSEDGRSFTFFLVKGVKWSDGQPFTADDIVFALDDVMLDKELNRSIPKWLTPTENPPKVTKIDDHTVRIEFDQPYSLFLQRLACPDGMELVTKPKHYLQRFHKKYAEPAALQALVEQAGVSSWVKLFHDKSTLRDALFTSTELPSICAWIAKIPAPAKRFIMERNPYYWKVDTAGNQLPYIDEIVHELQAEAQTIVLKAIAGEIDMQGRRLGGMQNSVLLLASMSKGDYKLVPKISTASVGLLLAPNLNHQDPAMRQILSDRRFRIALSHAINRTEINKIVYRGKGTPRQAAPLKESPFYSESYEKASIEFNPDKAKKLLQEMGLKLGGDGMFVRPDGKPLQIALDVMVDIQTWVDTAEIVASNLKKVGIDTEVKSETRDLFTQRRQTAAYDVALWPGDGGMECLLETRWYFPSSDESLHAPLWGIWFMTRGAKGQEPPPEMKELMDTYAKILAAVSLERQKELFARIIEANEKNLWVIGLVHEPPDYYVVSGSFHNVAARDFQSWVYPNPGPIFPEQFFMTRKAKGQN